jgi:hypothetical protein
MLLCFWVLFSMLFGFSLGGLFLFRTSVLLNSVLTDHDGGFENFAAAYPPSSQGPYVVAPPPAGYPTKDGSGYSHDQNPPPPVETKSRGDGFWKGW